MLLKVQPHGPSAGRCVLGSCLLALVAASSSPLRPARAADHVDAPLTAELPSTDLGDLYAWHTERGTLVVALTFAPLMVPGDPPAYDDDAVYVIHIDNTADPAEALDWVDNDNDNEADLRIQVRFGQNDLGDWGVQLLDLPGAGGPLEGPVETTLQSGTARAIAGTFDDPFFFDFEGFITTRDNLLDDGNPLDIAFGSVVNGFPVDFFAGTNTAAIVVEFDAELAVGGNPSGFLQLWATSGTL